MITQNGSCCILAVIVTYNRKHLLLESLDALLAQTRPLDRILVINNASTDGTLETLREHGYLDNPVITLVTLPTNIGGAGGFHYGLKYAFEAGFDWFWLMDDDTIPEPDALAQLLAAYYRFPAAKRPHLLASKVIWQDGSLHPMNIPIVKVAAPDNLLLAAQHATASIRVSTFVALLIHRSLVEKYGFPIADYFIWADDIEYTGRILRHELGVVVPASVVWHKTAKKYTRMDDTGLRYYYHLRNSLWIITRSPAFSTKEKLKDAIRLLFEIPFYLKRFRFNRSCVKAVLLGIKDGLFKSPKQ